MWHRGLQVNQFYRGNYRVVTHMGYIMIFRSVRGLSMYATDGNTVVISHLPLNPADLAKESSVARCTYAAIVAHKYAIGVIVDVA